MLLVAVGHLLSTLDVPTGDASPAASGEDGIAAQALLELAAFHSFYDVGLLLLGVHLALLGHLAFRSGFVPRVIGALLVLAGAGYAVDSAGAVLALDLPTVSVVTFLGEPLLAVWLLVAGRRLRAVGPTPGAEVRRAR